MAKKVVSVNYCSLHEFSQSEIDSIRTALLKWYSANKRDLPWRRKLQEKDPDIRAYSTWVSEIMLQQTQVATVIDYYNRWMKKWPTVIDLANTTLEEVNELWSGLGYYSRARRLHEGAQKVSRELGGFPRTASKLRKEIPGVGDYTSAAVASIAFGEPVGLVDGNVMRVLARLRTIGSEVESVSTRQLFWRIADALVDPEQPGDFNQALMELGATVCLPKSPHCTSCPVRSYCSAQAKVSSVAQKEKSTFTASLQKKETVKDEIEDIENCAHCLKQSDYVVKLGVGNFPRKKEKKAPKEDLQEVVVTHRGGAEQMEIFLVKRTEKGLLAGLWEFPEVNDVSFDVKREKMFFCGEVLHIFSHVRRKYSVSGFRADNVAAREGLESRWMLATEFEGAAVSKAMRKVFAKFNDTLLDHQKNKKPSRKRKSEASLDSSKRQVSITSFFK